ncbi:MAG: hypothetical protein M1819_004239 [Sarea resinae]|nr:MAG: hypothetical protein M1819_004239 [Sarea resinae]
MPREPDPSLNERAFTLQALRESIRLDGRALDAFRDLDISFGDEYGVVDLRLGKTRILTRISASLVPPFPDRKFDGIFTITTELSPLASPAFESNRPSTTETLLSRLLEKTIRRSGALDTESLCVSAGSKVWSLRADVHVLSHDGGLVDASCVAIVAALRHFRVPDTSVVGGSGGEVKVWSVEERVPVPLSLLHFPVCVTFSFFDIRDRQKKEIGVGDGGGGEGGDEDLWVIDATLAEEKIRSGEVVVGMNSQGEVCQMAKLGGAAVDALTLLRCADLALVKCREITSLVTKKLEEDARARDLGGLMAELRAENER